uniref:Protein arginine deiminase-like 346 n=2 Tax=Saccoglossus kowalevskii TaxID=10224 RepID=A0A0U2K753_SACKO|nr:protein arginine deiminase-like 346 [Saccoglossus kowalevskii]
MGSGVSLPGGIDNVLSDFKPKEGRYPLKRYKAAHDVSRVVHLKREAVNFDLCVVGTTLEIPLNKIAPTEARSFIVETTHPYHIDVRCLHDDTISDVASQSFHSLATDSRLLIDILRPGITEIQVVIDFDFIDHGGSDVLNPHYHYIPTVLNLRAIYISLDVDSDRDGEIEHNSATKDYWKWGMDGYGPMLAMKTTKTRNLSPISDERVMSNKADGDPKLSDAVVRGVDEKEFTILKIRLIMYDVAPAEYQVCVSVDEDCKQSISIYTYTIEGLLRQMIGPETSETEAVVRWPPPSSNARSEDIIETKLLAQGQQLYDGSTQSKEFVAIKLSLYKKKEVIYEDKIYLRVCPWILPSPLAAPVALYVVDDKSEGVTETTVDDLRNTVEAIGASLVTIPRHKVTSHPEGEVLSAWMACGFTQTTEQTQTMVAVAMHQDEDSKRDLVLGSHLNYFTIGKVWGFDRIMATPPMYPYFPLGALLVSSLTPGGETPGNWKFGDYPVGYLPQSMTHFINSQKVQPIVEVFTDWLANGDIASVVNFVPATGPRGFKAVTPSMYICRDLLLDFRKDGEGFLCEGKTLNGIDASIKVSNILADREFWKMNQHFQSFIDFNRKTLRRQLGLQTDDFIELPALWQRCKGDKMRAVPFFPNMTSMMCLGDNIIIPKPHGPKRKYQTLDRFEKYTSDEFKSNRVTANVQFVDDWQRYFDSRRESRSYRSSLSSHVLVQRRPGSSPAWWEIEMS